MESVRDAGVCVWFRISGAQPVGDQEHASVSIPASSMTNLQLLLGILIILGVSSLSKLGSVGQPLSELCPFLCIDLVYRPVLVP